MDCSPSGSSVYGILQARRSVGCHFLLQGIFLTQGSNLHLLCLLCCRQILYHLSHWGSQARILKSVAIPFSRGYFQEWNPGLPYWRWILYQLRHQGNPRILEWVVYPFSRGSSWPRNQTTVSCVAGRFVTNWAIREALLLYSWVLFHCMHVPHLFYPFPLQGLFTKICSRSVETT